MSLFSRKRFAQPDGSRRDIPEGLWMKCEGCRQMVYKKDVEDNLKVCPVCGRHYRLGARARVAATVDADSFEETHAQLQTCDPLEFTVGAEPYRERVERAQAASGLNEALLTGMARMNGITVALGVMDAEFIMGSMGSVVGEKFCRLVDDAIAQRAPLLVFAASGGARMQEGILALMQMARTADAVRRIQEARLPYICVLTDPTTGGVWASFASLSDILIAEPGAYIGFAGKRLIMGALKVKLPEGFQSAEYQLQNGFLDAIVKRQELRSHLIRLLTLLTAPRCGPAQAVPAGESHVGA